MRLLVTRPEPECGRTAASLRERGHDVLRQAMLRIEPVAEAELGDGPWAAVLFTSANAVRAVSAHRRFGELAGLPVHAVGNRTQAAARAAGFARIMSADGDVNALVELVLSSLPPLKPAILQNALQNAGSADSSPPSQGRVSPVARAEPEPRTLNPLLYCAGEDRAGDLAAALQARGIGVDSACVYRAAMVADLAPDVRAAIAGNAIDAVLHYSARTAAAFLAAATAAGIRDLSIQARHLCLSAQVAAPLLAAGATAIDVAKEPNEQALFALIAPSLSFPVRREG